LVAAAVAAGPGQQRLPDRPITEHRGIQGLPFEQQRVTHRFLITARGGHIEIVANDAGDQTTIEQVRGYLRKVATAFSNGDFDEPGFVHENTPPGVAVMRDMKSRIRYAVRQLPTGARLVIEASNFNAKDAVHQFLTFLNQQQASKSKS
jgi:hypothetical protein